MTKFETLLGYYIGITAALRYMETPPTDGLRSCLQYNEEREKERLEKVRQDENYKKLMAIKSKIDNTDCVIDIGFSDFDKLIKTMELKNGKK